MPTATKTDEATPIEGKLDRLADCPECLAGNLAWLLSQAHFAMLSELHAALRPQGITPRGYHVLVAAQTGERTQTELAGLVGLDKTTMVVTVDELESEGLAERVPSKTDRRARVISVTPKGDKVVEKSSSLLEKMQAEVLESLPRAERRPFLEGLATLVKERLSDAPDCPGVRRREPQ